jgi:murein DD-endopeptidase MepM/ murein hydrolase activator NlpD
MASVKATIDLLIRGSGAVNQLISNVAELEGIVNRINSTPLNVSTPRLQANASRLSQEVEAAARTASDLQQRRLRLIEREQSLTEMLAVSRQRVEDAVAEGNNRAAARNRTEVNKRRTEIDQTIRDARRVSTELSSATSASRRAMGPLINVNETIRSSNAIEALASEYTRFGDSLRRTSREVRATNVLPQQIAQFNALRQQAEQSSAAVSQLRQQLRQLGGQEVMLTPQQIVSLGNGDPGPGIDENQARQSRNRSRDALQADLDARLRELNSYDQQVQAIGQRVLRNQARVQEGIGLRKTPTGSNTTLNIIQAEAEALALVANNSVIASAAFNKYTVAAEASSIKLARSQQASFRALSFGLSAQVPGAGRAPAGLGQADTAGVRQLIGQTISDTPNITRSVAGITAHVQLLEHLKTLVPILSIEYRALDQTVANVTEEMLRNVAANSALRGQSSSIATFMSGYKQRQAQEARITDEQARQFAISQRISQAHLTDIQKLSLINSLGEASLALENGKLGESRLITRELDKQRMSLERLNRRPTSYQQYGALGTAFMPVSGKMPGGRAYSGSPASTEERLKVSKKFDRQQSISESLVRKYNEAEKNGVTFLQEKNDLINMTLQLQNKQLALTTQNVEAVGRNIALYKDLLELRTSEAKMAGNFSRPRTAEQIEAQRRRLLDSALGIQNQLNNLESKGASLTGEKAEIESYILKLKNLQNQASQKEIENLATQIQQVKTRAKEERNALPVSAKTDPNTPLLERFLTKRFGESTGRRASSAISEGIVGGAFPLLFGQGLGASALGGLGGALGGFAGGGLGFGLSLIGTAVGSALDGVANAAKDAAASLQDPITNFQKLADTGLALSNASLKADQAQQLQIKNLIEYGNSTKAVAIIQEELARKIGVLGMKDMANLNEQSVRLGKAWSELSFQIQAAIAGPLARLLEWMANIVEVATGVNRNNAKNEDDIFRKIMNGGEKATRFVSGREFLSKVLGTAVNQRRGGESTPASPVGTDINPKLLQDERDKNLQENRDKEDKLLQRQRDTADLIRNSENQIRQFRYQTIDLERSATDLRRRVNDDIFNKQQSIAQKEISNDQLRSQIAINAIDLQYRKTIANEDGRVAAVLSAEADLVKLRKTNAAELEAARRQLELNIAKQQRETQNYIYGLAREADSIRRSTLNLELQVIDYKIQQERKIQDLRKQTIREEQEAQTKADRGSPAWQAYVQGKGSAYNGGNTVSGFPITSRPGMRWGKMHRGIDVGLDVGTPLGYSVAGKVTRTGPLGGYGKTLEVLLDNGITAFVAHLSEILVNAGDRFEANQILARTGNTGTSTGPHAHFEGARGGDPYAPLPYVVMGKGVAAAAGANAAKPKPAPKPAPPSKQFPNQGWPGWGSTKDFPVPGLRPSMPMPGASRQIDPMSGDVSSSGIGDQFLSLIGNQNRYESLAMSRGTDLAGLLPSQQIAGLPAEVDRATTKVEKDTNAINPRPVITGLPVSIVKGQLEALNARDNEISKEAILLQEKLQKGNEAMALQRVYEVTQGENIVKQKNRELEIAKAEAGSIGVMAADKQAIATFDARSATVINQIERDNKYILENTKLQGKEKEKLAEYTQLYLTRQTAALAVDRAMLKIQQEMRFNSEMAAMELEFQTRGAGAKAGFFGAGAQAYNQELVSGSGDSVKAAEKARSTRRNEVNNEIVQMRENIQSLIDPTNQVIAGAKAIGDAFSEGFKGVVSGSVTGRDALADFFQKTGQHFLEMATQILTQQLVLKLIGFGLNSLGSNSAGSGIANTFELPGAGFMPTGGFKPFANGGMFTNSIVSSPTLFQFANGGALANGLMGEAGPEAVIPLSRGPGGRLGVDASGMMSASRDALQQASQEVAASREALQQVSEGGSSGTGSNGYTPQSKLFTESRQALATSTRSQTVTTSSSSAPLKIETIRIGSLDVVTVEQAKAIADASSVRGNAKQTRLLQSSPSARRSMGI